MPIVGGPRRPTYDFSVYYVEWDSESHRFTTWLTAKEFLLNELWWLAEDLDHEPTFEAWSEALLWEDDGDFPKMVKAGHPSALYSIVRRRPA